ncbi:type II secretion system GspH family protein, partial [Patescibacteria group bacterium]|nr:type II secretion system GspH family protein [Patescibacteria group bacterium]
NNRGYTLIEILTVSGIMALLSLTLIGIFLATIRGGTKAQLVSKVHQEGDFALKSMTKMIREAESIDNCIGNFTLTSKDSQQTWFTVYGDKIASASSYHSGQLLTSDLTNASALNFSCYEGTGGNQIVTVSFILSVGQAGAKVSEKVSQTFATSVSTRQY